ncbi:MAG: hypothetical protein KF715_16195 [Candidatus Didemnitutus sp.]|nr:hypothetical protein [Candidatus Didemnitutus sp.]
MNTPQKNYALSVLLALVFTGPLLRASDDTSAVLRVMNLNQVEQSALDSQRDQLARIEIALFEAHALGVQAKSFDADKNGRISAMEYRAYEQAVFAAAQKDVRMLQRYDADRDGKLSRKEWSVARADLMPL